MALRDGDRKIVGDDTRTRFRLFDLSHDWNETKILAAAEPGCFEELKRRLSSTLS